MTGAERRSFQAAMAVKYCGGSARQAERVFGWNRDTVALGLNERRTGVRCLGAQSAACGSRTWEEKPPEVAEALGVLADAHGPQDPTFRTSRSYTRLTVMAALDQLRAQGFPEERLPSLSTMAVVLNRNGYRRRKGVKAKPQQNSRKPTPSSPPWRTRRESPSRAGLAGKEGRSCA